MVGTLVDVTEALSIDFAAARPRRAFARNSRIRARIQTVAKRRTRLTVMSKFGGKLVQKLVKQGANPAAMYGVALTRFNEDMLAQVRSTAACGTPPYASGRSFNINLQLANLDPGPDATGAPLVRWA